MKFCMLPLLFTMAFSSLFSQEQTLRGTMSISNSPCFDKAEYSLTYSFSKEQVKDEGRTFRVMANVNPTTRFPSQANFNYQGQKYSPADLELSEWPYDNRTFLNIKIAIYYDNTLMARKSIEQSGKIQIGHQYVANTYSTSQQQTVNSEVWFVIEENGSKMQNFDIRRCKIEVEGFDAGPTDCPQKQDLVNIIAIKKQKLGNSNGSGSGGNGTNNNSTGSSSNSNANPAIGNSGGSSSQPQNELIVNAVASTVSLGMEFFGGLLSEAKAKRQKEIDERLTAAEKDINPALPCKDISCMRIVGDTYYSYSLRSDGTYKHYPEIAAIAAKWYAEAAKYNDLHSLKQLILIYKYDAKDKSTFKHWLDKLIQVFEQQVQKGDAESMAELADIYANNAGYLSPYKDNKKAMELYERAAALNSTRAIRALRFIYEFGENGKKKDYEKVVYYNKLLYYATKKRDEQDDACQEIATKYYKGGQGLKKDTTMAWAWMKRKATSRLSGTLSAINYLTQNNKLLDALAETDSLLSPTFTTQIWYGWYHKTSLLRKLGRINEADVFSKYVLDTANLEAGYNCGVNAYSRKDFDEADRAFKYSYSKHPGKNYPAAGMVLSASSRGDYDAASKYLNEAMSYPQSPLHKSRLETWVEILKKRQPIPNNQAASY